MIHPRLKIQEIIEAYNLEYEEIEYGNGWPYNFTAQDNQTFPKVFFVNPAQGVREQWFWRWNVRLWVVDQVKDIAQPIEVTNPVSDDMLAVCNALYLQIEKNTGWDLTGFGVRELQRKGDHNVTGWEVTFNALIPADCTLPPPAPSRVFRINANTTVVNELPNGLRSGDIIEFINSGTINPGVLIGVSNWPENARLTFRSAAGTTVTIAHNYNGNGIELQGGYNAVIEDDAQITIQRIGSTWVYVEQSRSNVPTFTDAIYIAGLGGSHETAVLNTYLAQYPESESRIIRGWLNRNTQESNSRTFFVQFMQACGYRVEQIVCGYINIFQGSIDQQWNYFSSQCPSIVVPIGGNSDVEITYPAIFQGNIVRVSAGDETERTLSFGNSLEFWDTETANSWVVPLIAAKLMEIADIRDDGNNDFQKHAGARYAARVTAARTETTHPSGQDWNKQNGYGKVNVANAIALTAPVPTAIFTQEFDFSFDLTFG